MPEIPSDPRGTFGPAAEKYVASQVHSNPAALQRLVEIAQPNGGTLIDIATGSGHTALAFASHVERVIATDMTQDMLLVCRREALARNQTNVQTCIALAEFLPFRSESFEAMTCRMGAHHFGNVPQFLREARRILKPKGWFLLIDTTGPEGEVEAHLLDQIERMRDPSHGHDYSPKEWRLLLGENGFQLEHEEGSRKTLEATDWMTRTSVPIERRNEIVEAITDSQGELREYLDPRVIEDKLHFDLHEHAFLAMPNR